MGVMSFRWLVVFIIPMRPISPIKTGNMISDHNTTPSHDSPTGNALEWRVRLLMLVVCGFWLLLGGRLVQLQWFSRHRFSDQVEQQSTFLEEIPARPGEILDRDGRVLATTIATKSFFVVPSRLTQTPGQWELVRKLAEAVGQDPDQLQSHIAEQNKKHFFWVRRRIADAEVVDRLSELKWPRDLGGFRDEFMRQYPQGHLAAHVIGGRDIDGVGRGGVEQHLNEYLTGKAGHRRLVLDSRRRVIDMQTDIGEAPQHGKSITLSLDTVIQLHVEEELDKVMEKWRAKHSAAIVLDAKTGEVLAMASRPTYDPNDLTHVNEEAWKNQTIAAMYEPGSTFKPFVVGWGIDHGLIRRDESFNCENGTYFMGRRELHDHHKYGVLNVTDILVKSSNIGMAKIGERVGNAELYRAAVTFGFGRQTGIELPGELAGRLHPLKKWTSYSTGSIPMGQEVAVTPLQLASAYTALTNGGKLISPRLVRGTRTAPVGRPWAEKLERNRRTAEKDSWLRNISLQIRNPASRRETRDVDEDRDDLEGFRDLIDAASDQDANGDEQYDRHDRRSDEELIRVDDEMPLSSAIVSKTIRPEVTRWLVESVMTEVIKRGTAKKARLDDYTVFGKTGTAQKRDPATGKYSNRLHVSSFVGGAPAANPRVIVLVMVDEPSTTGEHFGGDIAAPPAREIIHKSLIQLGVPPEQKPAKSARVETAPLR